MSTMAQALNDGWVVAQRIPVKIVRVPEILVFVLISPIMFVLLFAYVFGGSIEIPGMDYREFLMAGIFAQTVLFGATITGSGLAEDMTKGIIDRFRSLPMARSAVLVGRTTSDLVNNTLVIVIMMITGLIVGWRIHSSPLEALAAVGILLLFAYAFSWAMAWIGLLVRSPEVFNNASFIFLFPITYIANTFVQSERLPSVLRHIAEWNPVSAVTLAARELFGNTSPQQSPPDVWPLQHPVLAWLGWVVIFLLIFVPLANYQYKRAVAR